MGSFTLLQFSEIQKEQSKLKEIELQQIEKFESKKCNTDDDCIVFGKNGDCNTDCFNKNYGWKPSGEICNCANTNCMIPASCQCINNKCQGFIGEKETVNGNADKNIELLAKELCKNKESLPLNGYDGGKIYKCGDYLEVFPPNDLMDAPIVVFDSAGSMITSCGGMPGPIPIESPKECEIKCEITQLKFCSDK